MGSTLWVLSLSPSKPLFEFQKHWDPFAWSVSISCAFLCTCFQLLSLKNHIALFFQRRLLHSYAQKQWFLFLAFFLVKRQNGWNIRMLINIVICIQFYFLNWHFFGRVFFMNLMWNKNINSHKKRNKNIDVKAFHRIIHQKSDYENLSGNVQS